MPFFLSQVYNLLYVVMLVFVNSSIVVRVVGRFPIIMALLLFIIITIGRIIIIFCYNNNIIIYDDVLL